MIWSFGKDGPLWVDLSADPPRQVRVLPDLFLVDLTYPDQMSSIGMFYSPADDSYHIVAQVNLPDDRSIYVYHSESGKKEKLAGDRPVMMILPGDQRMPLVPWQDKPGFTNDYELIWVDAPDRAQAHLQIEGHMPREYSDLQTRLLPGGGAMLFGSSQGISQVELPGGSTQAFWRLSGLEKVSLPILSVAPGGNAVIVAASSQNQGSALYWLAPVK